MLFDFGAVVDVYCSYVTRTVVAGPATAEQREVHEVVRVANERAAAAVRPGLTGRDADAVARMMRSQARRGPDSCGQLMRGRVGLGHQRLKIIDLSHRIHANPELAMQERRTAGIAAEWLRKSGYEVTEKVGGTGVVGSGLDQIRQGL